MKKIKECPTRDGTQRTADGVPKKEDAHIKPHGTDAKMTSNKPCGGGNSCEIKGSEDDRKNK